MVLLFLVRILRTALFCTFVVSASLPAQPQSPPQKRVLVLYALREGSPLADITNRALRKNVIEGLSGRIDYYTEYIDVVRFPEPKYQSALEDFLTRKYENQTFDLIITVMAVPFEFVEQVGSKLFPNTPVVFLGHGGRTPEQMRAKLKCTGVLETVNLRPTLDLALQLQPDIKQVFVASGVSDFDTGYETSLREQVRGLEGRLTFISLNDLPMEEIQKKIASLTKESIIYYLIFTEDISGQRFTAPESLSKIVSAANVPVYIWFGGHMVEGVTGGSVMDIDTMATQTAELASRVLRGEKPEDIPIITADGTVNTYDWRQLKRWGIGEDRLPSGGRLLYKQPSFWEQYKKQIIAALALLVFQTFLIAVLLIERGRRKLATTALDERLQFETLLSELSAEFANLAAHEVESGIEKWVRRLGGFLGVDRSAFVDIEKDGTVFGTLHSDLEDDGRLELIKDRLRKGEAIAKPFLAIPISVNDASWALIFSSSKTHRDWSGDFVRRLRLSGEIFADALARKASEEALQQLTARVLQLQDEERRRIARELHDVTAQNLGTITINLEGLLQNRFRPSDVLRVLSESRTLGEQSLKELRTLSYVLHPPMLEQAGLVFALEWFIDGFIKRSGIHVGLIASEDMQRLEPEVEIALFRIVQECLINVHRHSGSSTAEIRLEKRDGHVVLEVKDQGRGLPVNGKGADVDDVVSVGVGIPGMKQRLVQLGGSLEIETSNCGTKVTAVVPAGNGRESGSYSGDGP